MAAGCVCPACSGVCVPLRVREAAEEAGPGAQRGCPAPGGRHRAEQAAHRASVQVQRPRAPRGCHHRPARVQILPGLPPCHVGPLAWTEMPRRRAAAGGLRCSRRSCISGLHCLRAPARSPVSPTDPVPCCWELQEVQPGKARPAEKPGHGVREPRPGQPRAGRPGARPLLQEASADRGRQRGGWALDRASHWRVWSRADPRPCPRPGKFLRGPSRSPSSTEGEAGAREDGSRGHPRVRGRTTPPGGEGRRRSRAPCPGGKGLERGLSNLRCLLGTPASERGRVRRVPVSGLDLRQCVPGSALPPAGSISTAADPGTPPCCLWHRREAAPFTFSRLQPLASGC